jgi:capsular polysaccharide biosynthesis protein
MVAGYLGDELYRPQLRGHISHYEQLFPPAFISPTINRKVSSAHAFLPKYWNCDSVNLYWLKDAKMHSNTGIVHLDDTNMYVEEFSWGWGRYKSNKVRQSTRDRRITKIKSKHPTYVAAGRGYHSLIEDLPAILKLCEKKIDLNVVIEKGNKWLTELLNYFTLSQVKFYHVEENTWVKADTLLCMSKCAHAEYINPNYIKILNSQSLPGITKDTPKKIFVSRNDASNRLHSKEAELGRDYKEAGFELVELGKLAIEKQLSLFVNAREIAGFHGAGLVNLVWCQSSAAITEFYDGSHFTNCYFCLSEILQHQHSLVFID